MIPKGTKYKSTTSDIIYEHYGSATLTFRQQEEKWRQAAEAGKNRHRYLFIETDWTPDLFEEKK
jgi:hypothetical protein